MKLKINVLVTLIVLSTVFSAFGATYYVSNAGNDENTGESDAQAWATIGKVHSNLASGDKIYFKCGSTFDHRLGSWNGAIKSGTSNNYTVFGAYYMNNGQETVGVSGQKPIIIDGNETSVNEWKGLVELYGNEYVTLENLEIKNSSFYNVKVFNSQHINLTNLTVSGSVKAGIMLQGSGGNSIRVNGCNISSKDNGIYVQAATDVDIIGNTVHDTGDSSNVNSSGNGILATDNTVNIERNTIYNTLKNGIKLSNSDNSNVIRNLIYNINQAGVSVNTSNADATADNCKIIGNWIAKTIDPAIKVFREANLSTTTFPNFEMYNNSIVSCGIGLGISENINFSSSHIKNNLFLNTSDQFQGASSISGVTFSNNLWSSPETGAPSNDSAIIIALPLLQRASWSTISAGTLKISDFALLENSPGINAGATLSAPYNVLADCDVSELPETIVLKNQSDFGQFDVGADIYAPGDTPPDNCGNTTCDEGETNESCPGDCYCGNTTCDEGETNESCPGDCPPVVNDCGNDTCDPGETNESCPGDCYCGNTTCDEGETNESCPGDCPLITDLTIKSYRLVTTTIDLDSDTTAKIRDIMEQEDVERVVIEK